MTYHYIYITRHKNGWFYIGRHSTENLDDGYIGSGVWVSGIKDKTSLEKEILEFVDNSETLKVLEEEYIDLHWEDPQCMNRGKGSSGWTSEEAFNENKRRINDGSHNFIGGEIPKKNQLRRVAEGIHQWSGDKNPSLDRIKNGTHIWLKDEHKIATSNNFKKRIETGEHHFLQKVKCPFCDTHGQMTAMKRWHFDKCKYKGR